MKEKGRELENNIYFWQKLDTIVVSGNLVITSKKGTASPEYPQLVLPVDAATISDPLNPSAVIYGYRGSQKSMQVNSLVVKADILDRSVQTRVLIGCTEEECIQILKFINATEFQKAILVRRGTETPAWADSDQ